MNFFDHMTLSPETKAALDRALLWRFILSPLLVYGLYRAGMALATHTIRKYTKEEE